MTVSMQEHATRILLVEDNKIDARLTRHAFQRMTDWPCAVEVADDGEKAIHFLSRQDTYSHAERPNLVILDLNLPKRDGIEVLRYIRGNADLRNLLVFIFSSSPIDVAQGRASRAQVEADCYFEKPNEVGTYFSIAEQIREAYQRAHLLGTGATA